MPLSDRATSMRRLGVLAALAALIAVAFSPSADAQPAAGGRVSGVITDSATGAPLEGATVVLIGPAGSSVPDQKVASAGADGRFAFDRVRPGTYQLDFTHTGYGASSIARLEVVADREAHADLAMTVRSEEDAESTTAAPGG